LSTENDSISESLTLQLLSELILVIFSLVDLSELVRLIEALHLVVPFALLGRHLEDKSVVFFTHGFVGRVQLDGYDDLFLGLLALIHIFVCLELTVMSFSILLIELQGFIG
jgi:hypothetical protein